MPKGKGYNRPRRKASFRLQQRAAAETGMFGRRAKPAGSGRAKRLKKKRRKRSRRR